MLSADTTDIDMGLSFNVFVNTSVATAGSVNTTRSDQGSLDQALRNAANIIGPNALRFVPAVATNASGAGGNWWSIDYDNLGVSDEPHRIEDKDTVVDGTAFDLADGTTPRDTNSGFLGSNAAGGVTVGVSASALPQVTKPELEIIGRLQLRTFAATRSPENAIIRDLAIWGNVANALIDIAHSAAVPAPNILIENVVVGSRPDVFADAGGSSSRAIWTRNPVEDGTIRNSLIGFQGSTPAMVQVDPGWVVEYNEFAGALAGIYTTDGNLSVHHNLFNGVAGNFIGGPTPQPFEENTLSNSTGGALTLMSDGHTVRRNIFEDGASYGVGVSHDQGPPTPAHDNHITDNVFTNNGSVAIDLFDSLIGEDAVTKNDGTTTAGSGNQAFDYPVIDGAYISGGNLTVVGFARPNVEIEFYRAVGAANDNNAAGNPHGEGTELLFTETEGVADADAATGATYPDTGYGTDPSVNRFSFTVALSALPSPLNLGDEISPIAYSAGQGTSEFGPNYTVGVPTADLTLTKTDNPDPAPLDGPLLYVLSISNAGPEAATGVTVTDTLPASVTLVSATPSQGIPCTGTTTISCNLGTILKDGTASVEILVIADALGTITNNANVTANEVDPVPADNSASIETDVVVASSVDVPLTQYTRIAGFLDYTVTGGSLRTGDTSSTRCDITTSSSENVSGIPATATIRAAYLYWAASGSTVDSLVTFDGALITADRTFQANLVVGSNNYEYFGGFKDVTTQIAAKADPNDLYEFSGLTIDNGNPWCQGQGVMGGWTMYVIYEDASLSGKTLVFYDGFDIERNGATDYLLSGIYATGPPEAKTTIQTWEGDIQLGTGAEELQFNGSQVTDALNPPQQLYNSTINNLGVTDSWGVDADTFDVSSLVNIADTSATTLVGVGPDLVILNSVLLQVKSNVIAGDVFEDVNYGGGAGQTSPPPLPMRHRSACCVRERSLRSTMPAAISCVRP